VSSYSFSFTCDPGTFLAAAGDLLAVDPVVTTVVGTVTRRLLADAASGAEPPEGQPRWWVVVHDETGEVVSAAMRTAPVPPYPIYLLPMPEAAAAGLARELHARGEEVLGANGSRPAVDVFADETARLVGRQASVGMHTRLFVLDELVEPAVVPGRLRVAEDDDVDLAIEWFAAFHHDADLQAGREPGQVGEFFRDRDEMLRRIREGRLWFWLDESGERVHMTGANPSESGVARVGPVYTPPAARGRGYASVVVAAVSRMILDSGARACLFTDQANPTSNKIYQNLGYLPVVDQANLVIE